MFFLWDKQKTIIYYYIKKVLWINGEHFHSEHLPEFSTRQFRWPVQPWSNQLRKILCLITFTFWFIVKPIIFLISFPSNQNVTYQWYELPVFIAMGAFGGLIGALFNFINIKLTKFRNDYIKKKLPNIVEGLLVASMSAVIGFSLSYCFSSDCQPIGRDLVSKYPVQLFCDDGQYNAMSGLFFQTPEKSVRSLFHDPPGSFNPVTLSVFCVVSFVNALNEDYLLCSCDVSL